MEKPDGQWLLLDRRLMLILNSSCCVELFKPHSECRVWREREKKKEALSRPGNASENLG